MTNMIIIFSILFIVAPVIGKFKFPWHHRITDPIVEVPLVLRLDTTTSMGRRLQ